MEYNSSELYKLISNLVQRHSYEDLEQILSENKHSINVTMLNELFELPLQEAIVNKHRDLFATIIDIADFNKDQLTLRHTIHVSSIKLAIKR